MSLASIQGVWKKDEELLAQPNAVVTAPGFDTSVKMVASRSGRRPHLVKCGKEVEYHVTMIVPIGNCLTSVHIPLQLQRLTTAFISMLISLESQNICQVSLS